MQHPNILMRHNMHRQTINIPQFNKIRLKRQNPRRAQRKGLRRALPIHPPLRPSPPPVPIHKERKLAVIEQELAIQPLNVNRFDVLLTC